MESDWIFQEVGSAIKDLVERFFSEPFFFYTEQDMHAYLYHELITGRLGTERAVTSLGDTTVLVHREYPTLNKYPSESGKATRGHFDLAVIDPAEASKSHWRRQQPLYATHKPKVAVEIGLNEIGTTKFNLAHYNKDFTRLTDPENSVERGYLLFFVRREDFLNNSGMHPVINEIPSILSQMCEQEQDRTGNLVVVYAECKKSGTKLLRVIPESRAPWVG